MGREMQAMGKACGHDQSVGWIAMKGFGNLIQGDHDLDIDRQHLNDAWGDRLP